MAQAKVSELQHAAAAAAKESAAAASIGLHKLQAAATSSIAGLRGQLGQLQGEVKGQLGLLLQQDEAALQELSNK